MATRKDEQKLATGYGGLPPRSLDLGPTATAYQQLVIVLLNLWALLLTSLGSGIRVLRKLVGKG